MSDNNKTKTISSILKESKDESWFEQYVVGNSPIIMAVFANFVVLIADYRVYDVIYQMTGTWWKALSASLACAVPFVLWEIAWQYNHTTEGWRITSLIMAGLAFVTSIVLGVADFVGIDQTWADALLAAVVVLTGIHTVTALLYVYNDPDVARRRRRKQAHARMLDSQQNAEEAERLLVDGSKLLGLIEGLEAKFGPDDVREIMALLKGVRIDTPRQQRQLKPAAAYQQTAPRPQTETVSKPGNPTKGTGE